MSERGQNDSDSGSDTDNETEYVGELDYAEDTARLPPLLTRDNAAGGMAEYDPEESPTGNLPGATGGSGSASDDDSASDTDSGTEDDESELGGQITFEQTAARLANMTLDELDATLRGNLSPGEYAELVRQGEILAELDGPSEDEETDDDDGESSDGRSGDDET